MKNEPTYRERMEELERKLAEAVKQIENLERRMKGLEDYTDETD